VKKVIKSLPSLLMEIQNTITNSGGAAPAIFSGTTQTFFKR